MKPLSPNLIKVLLIPIFLISILIGHAQIMQLEVTGGGIVTEGSTVTINEGTTIEFTITNVETANCRRLRVRDVDISNTADFDINPNNPRRNIKPETCNGGWKFLDFFITNTSSSCGTTSTLVTVEIRNQPDFTFTLEVNSSPFIYVLGGDPFSDIMNGDTATSEANGTYYGVVDEEASVTRLYIIANIGSCPLDITALGSSNTDFTVSSPYTIPFIGLDPYFFIFFNVTFTAPVGGTGIQTSTITIDNSDTAVFSFNVEAEMFNENIPGPGGITADFRLWLKATRGINETNSKLSLWQDLGTNGKDAEQPVAANQPTYLDDPAFNINFNPVVRFENDGGATEQFLFNSTNGFYSQDIFIVMIPDNTITNASSRNTIFAGTSSGSANDITGVGFGDYSSEFTNEVLSYNQDVAGGGSFNGYAELNSTYDKAGIINVRNNSDTSPTGQEILYNASQLTTSNVDDIAFANVGSPGPPVVLGTPYWIGKNFDQQGSLNGRVAEIFTFAERVTAADREKIESYLGIKYGITLGTGDEAQKDYINSFNTTIWDIAANAGYNYHIAGIGRDSISDLNQKQSKTLNTLNEITIGLGGIYDKNSDNPNEFSFDGDFLVWGSNNAAYSGLNTNSIDLDNGLTTSLIRIDRQWKIIEHKENINGDIEEVFLSIPESAFSAFPLGADEEYAMMISSSGNFNDTDIIDVVPMKSDGLGNLIAWYDFDGTKFLSFCKTAAVQGEYAMKVEPGDYLVGEFNLNLNSDFFTISAWVKSAPTNQIRTIMAKGDKLQLRLNTLNQVEVIMDDATTPRFTSDMTISDNKWHQITFVYQSGSIFLYVDGILDKSEQDVVAPSPNFNRFSVGVVYLDKDNIINPLRGSVDEIYVWDEALSQDQVRYLMNQQIERLDISGTDYVSGRVLPGNSVSNLVGNLEWSNLRAYYDFNTFYGSTTEGKTDARNFLRIHYLEADKTMVSSQTAPLPYKSDADGLWDSTTTWQNSLDNQIPNSTGLDGVTSIDWNIVETNHDINSGDRNITLLGLKNNSGTLLIADPAEPLDETNSGQGLTVTNYLEIDGVIDLVGESQLVQTEGSIIDAGSGGHLERDQQGTANSFNYNYWSSSVGPVVGDSLTRGNGTPYANASFNISQVLHDGTDSATYQSINFQSDPLAADNGPTSPVTISTAWFYKYYGSTDNVSSWSSIDENTSLQPGEGYTMKGSSGSVDVQNNFQNYVFKGIPYNGDINLPLVKNITAQNPTGDVDRLIGNPYPSAIDAEEFILDNLSIADGGTNENGTIINGALYFWDHFGQEDSHNLTSYVGGYGTRNLIGGVAAISNDARLNNSSEDGNPATGTKVPGPYIAVGQGFFVSTSLDGMVNADDTPILSVDGGDVVFKNSQRLFEREAPTNSVFMRSSSNVTANQDTAANTPMISLIYDSPSGYHRQIAVGVNSNASNAYDLGYDAYLIDLTVEDMYWIIEDNKFVIQGVDNFDLDQELPLGILVSQNGPARISLDAMNGMSEDIQVYLKDNYTNTIHQLNDDPFEFMAQSGTFEDRFSIVFKSSNSTLSVDEPSLDKGSFDVVYSRDAGSIVVLNNMDYTLVEIHLLNMIGQNIKSIKPIQGVDSYAVDVQSGVYLVQVISDSGEFSKKIIID